MFVPEMPVTEISIHSVLLLSIREDGGVALGSFELQLMMKLYLNLFPTLTPTTLV